MKKLTFIAVAFVFMLAANAFGQQLDAAFSLSSITSAKATTGTCPGGVGGVCSFPSLRGGAYPGFSADFLLHRRIGIEGDLSWKASQALYGGFQPYRPVYWDLNAIWVPRLTKNLSAEVVGGIGGEDLRFYGIVNCNQLFGCTNYSSSNHFMGDFGGGIRAYVWHDMFVRPEVRLYVVHNNAEFSSGQIVRFGVSLGYSFGGR